MLTGAISMTIYSKNNLPKGFYTYAYLDHTGKPYYIGKGEKDRAWKHKAKERVKSPSEDLVVILEQNLTEIGAFALERRYIAWFGRKDLGTGILENKTNGGEGCSGIIQTTDSRSKKSNALKGIKRSEETKLKMRLAKLGTKQSAEHISNRAKSLRETLRRTS
jgi:hypothetical protein